MIKSCLTFVKSLWLKVGRLKSASVILRETIKPENCYISSFYFGTRCSAAHCKGKSGISSDIRYVEFAHSKISKRICNILDVFQISREFSTLVSELHSLRPPVRPPRKRGPRPPLRTTLITLLHSVQKFSSKSSKIQNITDFFEISLVHKLKSRISSY